MKVYIEFGIHCTRCVEHGTAGWARSVHTPAERCHADRPCEYPAEHHRPRRRPYLTVRGHR